MSFYAAHEAFCRAPLHPGPCKGYKKGTASAPGKKAAKPKADAPAPKPAAPKTAKPAAKAKPKADAPPPPPPPAPAPAASEPAAAAGGQQVAPPGSAPPSRVTPASAIGTPHLREDSSLVFSAKGVGKSWKAHTDSLSDSQRAAVKKYTGPGYKDINAALRKPADAELSPQEQASVALAETVQSSMAPSPVSMTAFRGMNTNALGLGTSTPTPEQVKALEGSVMINDAFTSTTIDPGQSFEGNISMEIEVPRGTPSVWAEPFSEYEEEQELLLAAGAKMKVLGVEVLPPEFEGGSPSYKFKVRIVP